MIRTLKRLWWRLRHGYCGEHDRAKSVFGQCPACLYEFHRIGHHGQVGRAGIPGIWPRSTMLTTREVEAESSRRAWLSGRKVVAVRQHDGTIHWMEMSWGPEQRRKHGSAFRAWLDSQPPVNGRHPSPPTGRAIDFAAR